MKITQTFVIAKPLPVVWDFFHDIPAVARCMPGAEFLGTREDGKHSGKVSTKVGPFQASFEGEADVRYDDAAKAIVMEGKGVDRKGASRGKMTMNCMLASAEGGTKITVDADVQLSGAIAQFGRTGLITEIANVIVADFARNAERELMAQGGAGSDTTNARAAEPASPISGTSLLIASLKSWFRSLFRRSA